MPSSSRHHRLGLAQRRHVEADDQAVAQFGAHGANRVESMQARSISVLHTCLHLQAQPFLAKIAVLVEGFARRGHRDLRRDHLHLTGHSTARR